MILALTLLAAVAGAQDSKGKAPTAYVIRAKRILTGLGTVTEDGVIVVSDGKITGPEIPDGAVELKCEVVTPGFVEANGGGGIRGRGIEDSAEVTPDYRVLEDLDTARPDFERLARGGVTTQFLAPGNFAVIGGLAAITKTGSAEPRVVKADAALKLAFGDEPRFGNFSARGFGVPTDFHARRPNSRTATVMEMRLAFFDAERARREKKSPMPAGTQRLLDAMDGKLPVRVHARYLVDLRTALRVAAEFGFPVTIDEAFEAHRALPALKEAGAKLVLGPLPRDPMGGVDGTGRTLDFGDESLDLNLLGDVAAAGIPVALSAHGAAPEDDLAAQMRIAVRYGAPRPVALRAVTRGAAEVLGIADRVGSIEVGRDADLVLWSGDPFEWTSAPVAVFVDGRLVYRRAAP